MKIALCLLFALCFASTASAQCENGICLLPKVAATVQNVVSVPFRVVSSVSRPVSGEDCGCQGQCGQPGCTCAPQSAPEISFAAVPMRTPVRTVLRAPFQARPLKRLFSGCR